MCFYILFQKSNGAPLPLPIFSLLFSPPLIHESSFRINGSIDLFLNYLNVEGEKGLIYPETVGNLVDPQCAWPGRR